MPHVIVVQRREPSTRQVYSNYRDFDLYITCDEFVVKNLKGEISLFFPGSGKPAQGGGLSFPQEMAIAVGRALLTVAEGHLSEVTGTFPAEQQP